jgi:hypothetical protein
MGPYDAVTSTWTPASPSAPRGCAVATEVRYYSQYDTFTFTISFASAGVSQVNATQLLPDVDESAPDAHKGAAGKDKGAHIRTASGIDWDVRATTNHRLCIGTLLRHSLSCYNSFHHAALCCTPTTTPPAFSMLGAWHIRQLAHHPSDKHSLTSTHITPSRLYAHAHVCFIRYPWQLRSQRGQTHRRRHRHFHTFRTRATRWAATIALALSPSGWVGSRADPWCSSHPPTTTTTTTTTLLPSFCHRSIIQNRSFQATRKGESVSACKVTSRSSRQTSHTLRFSLVGVASAQRRLRGGWRCERTQTRRDLH